MPFTIEEAKEFQHRYRAKDESVLRAIGSVTLLTFSGPTAAGKNHTMEMMGYPVVGTTTTRQPRTSDYRYTYVSHEKMLEDIEVGRLVQYGININTKTIYASTIDDYEPNKINSADILTDVVDEFATLGFKKLLPVGVVTYPESWQERLDERFEGISRTEIAGRLDEAARSLETFLNSWPHRTDRLLIVSHQSLDNHNRHSIEQFVETGSYTQPQDEAYAIAEDMLKSVPLLRQRYLGTLEESA